MCKALGSIPSLLNQVWWCTPIILALGNEGKGYQVFKVILSCIAQLRPVKDTLSWEKDDEIDCHCLCLCPEPSEPRQTSRLWGWGRGGQCCVAGLTSQSQAMKVLRENFPFLLYTKVGSKRNAQSGGRDLPAGPLPVQPPFPLWLQ